MERHHQHCFDHHHRRDLGPWFHHRVTLPLANPCTAPCGSWVFFLSTDHTEDTEKDFRRMIKTTPSDFKPQTSDFIFALQALQLTVDSFLNSFLRYSCYSYSFEKAKTGAFRPHESLLIKVLTTENEDEYKFFGQHLRNSHFIFINLHAKS